MQRSQRAPITPKLLHIFKKHFQVFKKNFLNIITLLCNYLLTSLHLYINATCSMNRKQSTNSLKIRVKRIKASARFTFCQPIP